MRGMLSIALCILLFFAIVFAGYVVQCHQR